MYKKGAKGWLKHCDFILIDLLCLQLSFLAAYFIRHGFSNMYASIIYRNMALIMLLIGPSVSVFLSTFNNVLKRGYYKEFVATFKQVLLVVMLSSFYLFIIQDGDDFSRMTLLLAGAIYAVSSYGIRILWKIRLKKILSKNPKRSLLIVTAGAMTEAELQNVREGVYSMFHIAGIAFIDCDKVGQELDGMKIVANRDTVADYVRQEWVDEIYINVPTSSPFPDTIIESFIRMGITIHLKIANAEKVIGQKQSVEYFGNSTVLTTCINSVTPTQAMMKRAIDIVGGLVGCAITGVLFIFVAPIIYIKSPGPIFFSQIRVGKNGRKFKMYKFRSMYLDAEERKAELLKENTVADGMMFKIPYDVRIIGCKKLENGKIKKGFGNFIRETSIDEFPQFFNVLRGDMSLVGTRPPTEDEWEKYKFHHRARLSVKPGLTGMWQVSGRSGVQDFEEVVRLDKKYIADWNWGLDIKILLKTVGVVLRRQGAR